jgi:hypothetical protein
MVFKSTYPYKGRPARQWLESENSTTDTQFHLYQPQTVFSRDEPYQNSC